LAYGDGSDDQQSANQNYYSSPTPYWQDPVSYEMSRLSVSDRIQQVQGQPPRVVPTRRDSDERSYSDRSEYQPVRQDSGNSSDSELNTFHDRSASALTHTPFISSNDGQAARAGVPVEGPSSVYYSPSAAYGRPYSPGDSTAMPMGAPTIVYHEGSHIAARDQHSHPADPDLAGAVVNASGSRVGDAAFDNSFGPQVRQMRANLEVLAQTAAADPLLTPEQRVWARDRTLEYNSNDVHNHYATGGSDLADHLRSVGVPENSRTMLQSRWIVGEAQRRADSGGQVVTDIRLATQATPPPGGQKAWLAAPGLPAPKTGKAWNKQDQADKSTSKSREPWRESQPKPGRSRKG
jgi:hypothetical protein